MGRVKVLEKAMAPPLQYSCLENPMDGGTWQAEVHGVTKNRTRLSDFAFTFHFHALEKEMATHSGILAWRIPGMGEPGGCHLWGRTESNTTEVTQHSIAQHSAKGCNGGVECVSHKEKALKPFFSRQTYSKVMCVCVCVCVRVCVCACV